LWKNSEPSLLPSSQLIRIPCRAKSGNGRDQIIASRTDDVAGSLWHWLYSGGMKRRVSGLDLLEGDNTPTNLVLQRGSDLTKSRDCTHEIDWRKVQYRHPVCSDASILSDRKNRFLDSAPSAGRLQDGRTEVIVGAFRDRKGDPDGPDVNVEQGLS
jgi:hypothetical protein